MKLKEVAMASFEALFLHWPGRAGKQHKKTIRTAVFHIKN
jgi:hypothetical protein